MSGDGETGAPESVAVAGAGIGGLATSIALRRAGIETTIYEKAPDLNHIEVGGGFQIWPNAIKALRQIDCGDQVKELGMPVDLIHFKTWRGRTLHQLDIRPVAQRVGAPALNIRRQALHRVLAQALGDDAVATGHEVTGYTQDDQQIAVHFAGAADRSAELLVGADGLRSAVRAQLLGDGPPHYAKTSNWSASVEFEHPALSQRSFTLYSGRARRFVCYYVAPGQLMWYCDFLASEDDPDPASPKEAVLARCEGFAEPVEDIIAETDEAGITGSRFYGRQPVQRWTDGRATLLGDAAHPMLPNLAQGACQAIEDAVVLSKCLSSGEGLGESLAEYERRRMPRTNRMMRRSKMVGRLWHVRGAASSAVRDTTIKLFTAKLAKADERDWAFEV